MLEVGSKVRFDVTAEDIADGCDGGASSCPIALAGSRATGLPVSVCQTSINIWFSVTKAYRCYPPPDVVEFISAFDAGEPMSPFAFDLTIAEIR